MGAFDSFRYDGKRVLVVGGATGMGRATAELVKDAGAEVVVMDYAPVDLEGVTAVQVNLGDTASIDKAFEEVTGNFDAIFAAAGVADGTPRIEVINFLGHRYYLDKLRAAGRINKGGAVGFISSAAGLGWQANLEELKEYIAIDDVEKASAWAHEHNWADYAHSKQAINTYVAHECFAFLKEGIRINAICPGPTNTPLAQANAELWLTFGEDYRGEVGIEAATPAEQAAPLVFLCSDAASSVNGIVMVTDSGYFPSGITESFPAATPITGFLLSKW